MLRLCLFTAARKFLLERRLFTLLDGLCGKLFESLSHDIHIPSLEENKITGRLFRSVLLEGIVNPVFVGCALEGLDIAVSHFDAHEQSVREFMAKAKQYVEMPKLTPELLRAFIRRIEVFEKEVKYSHTCGNPVVIYYKFQMKKLETLTVMFGTYDEDAEEDIPA